MWAFNGDIGLGHALLVAASLLIYALATRIGHQYRHPSAALAWVLGMVAFPSGIVRRVYTDDRPGRTTPAHRTAGVTAAAIWSNMSAWAWRPRARQTAGMRA